MKSHFENITFKAITCFWCTVAIGLGVFAVLRIGHWKKILSELGKVWAGI